MIVACDDCGLKYKIDPDKIKGESARIKCKGCSAVITVNKSSLLEQNDNPETGQEAAEDTTTTPPAAILDIPKRSGMGLTTKVILLMLVVSILPGAGYFLFSFKQTNDYIIEETTNSGVKVSEMLAAEVDEWIDKNARVLQTLAELQEIQSMDRFRQEEILEIVQQKYPWMYLVFTTDMEGFNIARSDGKGLKDYSNRQYVKEVAKDNKALAWQSLIGKTSKKPALVLAVPIKNGDQTTGVLASAMTREAITEVVTNYRQGETGSVFIVDDLGKVVAHQDNAFVTEQRDLNSNPLVVSAKNQNKGMVEFKGEGNLDLIGFSQLTKLGWVLAVQQEKSEAFAALKKAQNFAYVLLAVTVIAIIIIAFIASRAIVTPIRKLTDAANRISVGELSVEIQNTSSGEIGDLADAIIRMQDSIRLSISRLKRRRK